MLLTLIIQQLSFCLVDDLITSVCFELEGFLNLQLTGVNLTLMHLSVKHLWFLKSAIFLMVFSHFLTNPTLSSPYLSFKYLKMLLSLFVSIIKTSAGC